jgi:biopolymer transport protein ExbD
MKLRNRRPAADKVPLDMTPMIDIVFQLQAFFIMTFSITANEGDFSIRMPLGAVDSGLPDDIPSCLKVELKAASDGSLAAVTLGERRLADVRALRSEIRGLVMSENARTAEYEVEFACDYGLNYEHVIDAVTAITGYRDPQGSIVKLVDKVKFAPPKRPPAQPARAG